MRTKATKSWDWFSCYRFMQTLYTSYSTGKLFLCVVLDLTILNNHDTEQPFHQKDYVSMYVLVRWLETLYSFNSLVLYESYRSWVGEHMLPGNVSSDAWRQHSCRWCTTLRRELCSGQFCASQQSPYAQHLCAHARDDVPLRTSFLAAEINVNRPASALYRMMSFSRMNPNVDNSQFIWLSAVWRL